MAEQHNRGHVASLGHARLTEWGHRREALGASAIGTLGRWMEDGGVSGHGYGDPTLAAQIRDEGIYACERAVYQLACEDPDIASLLVAHYVAGQTQRELASVRGLTQRAVQGMLLSGQSQVGSILAFAPAPAPTCRKSDREDTPC